VRGSCRRDHQLAQRVARAIECRYLATFDVVELLRTEFTVVTFTRGVT
jgi:hypothetical protein